MPPMTITIGNSNKGKKLLNYLEYTKNSDLNSHVHVFKQVIKVNGVTHECIKIAYFHWMLWDMAFAWGHNFVNNHLNYTFNKFA
jgi:hypothetical protein